MKTRGALLWELNTPFRIDEIDVGDPVADEVQIRVHAAGMCHSDYHLVTGATPIGLPVLGGHEGAGVVTRVGKNVTGIEEGDHVILAFIPSCGACPPCLKGFRSLCDRGAVLLSGKAIADGTNRVYAGSTAVTPMNLLGTFAPYMTVHKDSVVKIDKSVPFESAAIIGCAVPTGFGSATNVAPVQPGVSNALPHLLLVAVHLGSIDVPITHLECGPHRRGRLVWLDLEDAETQLRDRVPVVERD